MSIEYTWRSPGRKKGIFEVQVRGAVEGEEIIAAIEEEEPLKLNSDLCYLTLEQHEELEYIWKGPTQCISLHRLEVVELWDCSMLRNIFTHDVVTSLPVLRTLKVYKCVEWEGIFCEESLKNLSSSGFTCFPKLENIRISRCSKVKWLFSYSLASHCPSLKRIEIRRCHELEGVVMGCEDKFGDPPKKLFPKLKELRLNNLPKLKNIYAGYEFNVLFHPNSYIENCPNIKNIPLFKQRTQA